MTKTIAGPDLKDGEFEFALTKADGTLVGTAKNAADGSVKLPAVTFDAPGNYAYLVRENAADADNGVTYDNRTYAVVAQVTDKGDGTLAVQWQIADSDGNAVKAMAFENTYAAVPTAVQFGVGKLLDGRAPREGEFRFSLRGADESTPMPLAAVDGVQTVTNDATGSALFGTIGYEKAGEYHYVVNEVKGDDKTITYDDHEYDVTVRVTDDLKGSLVAAVEYPEGVEGIVFHNVYTKPVEPSKPAEPAQPAKPGAKPEAKEPAKEVQQVADTGADIALAVAAAAALILAGAGLLIARRRNE